MQCKILFVYAQSWLILLKQKMLSNVFSSFRCVFDRRSEEEVDMDKVTAAMVLTSLSTSPLVRSPPVKVNGEYHSYYMSGRPPPNCFKLHTFKEMFSFVIPSLLSLIK